MPIIISAMCVAFYTFMSLFEKGGGIHKMAI